MLAEYYHRTVPVLVRVRCPLLRYPHRISLVFDDRKHEYDNGYGTSSSRSARRAEYGTVAAQAEGAELSSVQDQL
eukprot:scaffold133953_cov48-Prasinocladus_malaysianus.AAC.2